MEPTEFYVTIPTLLGDTGGRFVLSTDPEEAAQRALDDALATGSYSAADIRARYRVQAHEGGRTYDYLLDPTNPGDSMPGRVDSGRRAMI